MTDSDRRREGLSERLERAASEASYGRPNTPEGWQDLCDLLLEAATETGQKYCPDCDQLRPRAAFYSNRSRPDGLADHCRSCSRARANGTAKYRPRFTPVSERTHLFVKEPDGGCWRWTGRIDSAGYGRVRVNMRTAGAHRAIYEELVGPIPEGAELDHLCRNRACVNPDHLEPVTPAENSRRGSGAKLNAIDVAEIRASTEPVAVLAGWYDVSQTTIYAVLSEKSWANADVVPPRLEGESK